MKKLRPYIAFTLAIAITVMSWAHADHGHESGSIEHDCIVCQLDAHKEGVTQDAAIFTYLSSASRTFAFRVLVGESSSSTPYSSRAPPFLS
ncbi:MAG: hypothetical protein K6L81_03055 [Agarilytica sp.]